MLKKMIAGLTAAILLLTLPLAMAEAAYDSVRINFEGGFSLSLPSDWVSFEVDEEALNQGIGYALGAVDGSRLMYVQQWRTNYASLPELAEALTAREDVSVLSETPADENAFLMYSLNNRDCTGCLTIHAGSVLNLMFTPQSDAEYMAMAAAIMDSCRWIESDEE